MTASVMMESQAPAGMALAHRGKVRDLYDLPGDRLLLFSTVRVSAFDLFVPNGSPR